MKAHERVRSLMRTPRLLWEVLARGRYDFDYDLMRIGARRMSGAKRWNLARSGLNLIHRGLVPWSMPLHLQVELTNYCSLRCPVCPVGTRAVTRPADSIDVGLFEQLMAEVGPQLLTLSLWGWGEPLLHRQLSNILQIAGRYPVATFLSTNGQNLGRDDVTEALVAFPPTFLIVAIDGLEDATQTKYRVGSSLEPILAGVRRLVELKRERQRTLPILHMRYIVMKHNQHELPRLPEFARAHGFDFLTTRTLAIIDGAGTAHTDLVPQDPAFRAYEYQYGARLRRSDFVCQQPFWFPSVFADGTIVACEQDYNAQEPLGRLSERESFSDIWYSEHAARVREMIRDAPQNLSFCRNCPYADHKAVPCAVQAYPIAPTSKPRILVPA